MSWDIKVFIVVLIASFQAKAENTYTAYLPKYIRPGFEISYTLSVFNLTNPVRVASTLVSSDEAIKIVASEVEIAPGSSKRIVVGSVPLGYGGATKFTLSLIAHDTISDAEIFSNSTDAFVYASKALSIYIQTDKAIYQPGQTIKFRAVCLKPDLRPFNGTISYQLQDPNDNIVLLENGVPLSHGVAGGEFPLNKDSVSGDWKISYIIQGLKETLPVTVKLYKLPKFKVEVQLPSVIDATDEALNVKLTATYTYGKPVAGRAFLKVYGQNQYLYYSWYGREQRQKSINLNNRQFTGVWEVSIPKSQLNEVWDGSYDISLTVVGSVTEALTETTFNDTQTLDAKHFSIKLKNLYKPETIKPGLNYTAYLRVTKQDGQLLTEAERSSNNLILQITYNYPRGHMFPEEVTTPYPWESRTLSDMILYDIPPDGTIVVTLEAKSDEFRTVTFRPWTNSTYSVDEWTAKRAESPSNSYLQITTRDNSVAPGGTATLKIRTTEAIRSFEILVISRGKILQREIYTAPGGISSTDHSYSLTATHAMIPDVRVLASYVRSDGEIVADYIAISVSLSLENQVSMTTSASNVDAGTPVSIKVDTSSAGAYVGIRAIDESVLLLKSGNDLATDRVVQDLNKYSESDSYEPSIDFFWFWYFPTPSGARDATEVFEKAGMIVLTDALLYKSPIEQDYIYPEIAFDLAADGVLDDSAATDVVQSTAATSSQPRTFFPETWLWNENVTGSDRSTTFHTTAPDTITSWVISAFSVSDEYGLGIADTSKITVFRKFFVSLNLPLKVTRGEIIIVQAIVFNYFETDQNVRVELSDSEKFEFIIIGDDFDISGTVRTFNVPADGAKSVSFPLRMNRLGDVAITVSAQSDRASDAIKRKVYVRPEGIEQCYSASVFVNRQSREEDTLKDQLEIRIPPGIVPGSAKAYLYVYGEILGSTMNNLGRLLRTPGGCGEQNMLRFAPDVFVTRYLYKAGALDDETREKAYKHFRDGYSIELKYKHTDGSYSAFGERDNSGSTWLTAFVAKCFIYARQLRPELVESHIIDQALDFLVKQQNDDGSFREPGHVSHTDMQGGVNSPVTMTAYVVIALGETDYAASDVELSSSIRAARTYLENNLEPIRNDPYALSLVAYALRVSGSLQAGNVLTNLESHATTQGGMTYWHVPTPKPSEELDRWFRPYYMPPSNDIEMTAYALLNYVHKNDLNSAIPVVKWLTSKQNDLGGYSSTQDTVIAVQALSEVAFLMSERDQNLQLSITLSTDDDFDESLTIDSSNSLVFNTIPVAAENAMVDISASGVGVGVTQLSVCYNIPSDPFETEPFDCREEVSSNTVLRADVNLCCRLKEGDKDTTGMFLMEVGLLNGFTVDLEDEKSRNSDADLVELGETSVNYYYNQMRPEDDLCAHVRLKRYAEVAASQPAMLRVSDFYKPDRVVARLYSVGEMRDAGPCQVCGEACAGCPGARLTDWRPWTPCGELCNAENSTRIRDCEDPNMGTILDPRRCEVAQEPLETRICPKENFPCPVAYDGLWDDLPSGYSERSYYRGGRNKMCTVTGVGYHYTSPRKDIPGSILDGSSNYFRCTNDGNANVIENADEGFTISLLVKVDSFRNETPTVLFALGREEKSPIMSLEKIWWQNELRFTLKEGNKRYKVRRIPIRDFVDAWKHIVITWSSDNGAKVYVDGVSVGISSVSTSRKTLRKPRRMNFYLGKTTYGTEWRRGYFSGVLSGLMLWDKMLSDDEVRSLYSFFETITEPEEEPTLSVRQLRFFAPEESRRCFTSPSTLSGLYSVAGSAGPCPRSSSSSILRSNFVEDK